MPDPAALQITGVPAPGLGADVGDLAVIRLAVRDTEGELADPDTVRFRVKKNDAEVTEWVYGTDDEIERTEAGRFEVHLDLDAAGGWWVRWEVAGDLQAADERQFIVRARRA